jgi:hypothetical protein
MKIAVHLMVDVNKEAYNTEYGVTDEAEIRHMVRTDAMNLLAGHLLDTVDPECAVSVYR